MNDKLTTAIRLLNPIVDPGTDADPEDATARRIHDRALRQDHPSSPLRRWRRRLVAAGVVAAATVGGAIAVADRPPPEVSDDVCEGGGTQWDPYPPPACADVRIPGVLASIEATGTDLERRIVADGTVSEREWVDLNEQVLDCLEAGGLTDVTLFPNEYLDITLYSTDVAIPDGFDAEAVTRYCDRRIPIFRISALYQAQAVGRQDGPRLTPQQVQSFLDEDAERHGDIYRLDAPTETMTELDEE